MMVYTDAAFLVLLLLIIWSFYRAQRDPNFDFNAFDIVMDHGKVSRIACVFMGAFAVHSWIMVKLTLDVKMSEGYLTIYGATWVAPLIAVIIAEATKGNDNGNTSLTVETHTDRTVSVSTGGDDGAVAGAGQGSRPDAGSDSAAKGPGSKYPG